MLNYLFLCALKLYHIPVPAVTFALGIPTVNRGNYSYLKQTLTSILSRMTLPEEKDSVVIVSIADVCMKNEWSPHF